MLMYSDYFRPVFQKNSFFAGANTPDGFKGEYENLLSEDTFEKVYIIKGGSGTGKSTLIKKAAEAAKKRGADLTYILCSSDPDSLDGVIAEKEGKKIAVIDGTAPHTKDPVYAGACGEIINCGDYWDSSLLEENKNEIASIIKEKSGAYRRAYRFLGAALEVVELQRFLGSYCLLEEKMKNAIGRLCDSMGKGRGTGNALYRRTYGFSMKGAVRLTTFENAENLFGVVDCAFLSPVFYKLLFEELVRRGFDVTVSLSPLYGIAELYVAQCDTAFVCSREGADYKKLINLRRFADKDKMAEVKGKRIFSSKCLASMLEGAEGALSEAGRLHFRLEKIYIKAMDFAGLDRLSEEFSKNIEKRL